MTLDERRSPSRRLATFGVRAKIVD